jgi:hypothetical protein
MGNTGERWCCYFGASLLDYLQISVATAGRAQRGGDLATLLARPTVTGQHLHCQFSTKKLVVMHVINHIALHIWLGTSWVPHLSRNDSDIDTATQKYAPFKSTELDGRARSDKMPQWTDARKSYSRHIPHYSVCQTVVPVFPAAPYLTARAFRH